MFALLKKLWLGIDGFILSVCQRISDKVYEKTGRSKFFLSKLFLHLVFSVNTAMLLIIILYRENLTNFGVFLFYSPVALMYILLNYSFSVIKVWGFLTDDSLYDNSEELKMTLMKWKKYFSNLRQIVLGQTILLLNTFTLLYITTKSIPNPFSDLILGYMYLMLMLIPFYSIFAYFASCKIIPIKGKVALMVAG